jgi:hypothetical protein
MHWFFLIFCFFTGRCLVTSDIFFLWDPNCSRASATSFWLQFSSSLTHSLTCSPTNSLHSSAQLCTLPFSCYSNLEHRASLKRFVQLQFLNPKTVGRPLGWGICPTQGRYLHRKTQPQNKRRHPCLGWDSNPRFLCSSEWRQFMP